MPRAILHLFHQSGLLRHATAGVTLLTFTWVLIYSPLLTAQTLPQRQFSPPSFTPRAEAELSEILAQIEIQLTRLRQKFAQAEDDHRERTELAQLRRRLIALDRRVRQYFEQMAQHLHNTDVSAEILQRHQVMVATYEAQLSTLQRYLDALDVAHDVRDRTQQAERILQHLKEQQPRHLKRSVNPQQLPFHVPDGKVRPPKETKEEFKSLLEEERYVRVAATEMFPGLLVPLATLPLRPTVEDLAPTEDVQLTAEIRALAVSLNNNPVQIFNWVYDQIDFLPTYGSIQGAHQTLQTKRGNAFDTASLLIALLRAANIHARYVLGTVQIPIEKVMNWVGGVNTPEAALQVLSQGGIPNVALTQGGAITAVKLEHVWVEAWVDFEPSRGAIHRVGDTWIPLDASFKQYQYTSGMAIQANVPFDAHALVQQVTASAQVNAAEGWVSIMDHTVLHNALMTYQTQLNTYVTTQKPTATVGEVLGTKTIIAARRPVLAAGLPYHPVVQGLTVRLLPDHLRHKFRFALYGSALEQLSETPILTLQQSLPLLAGKRLTLSFTPATSADANLIASYLPQPPAHDNPLDPSTLPTSLPGYLIRVSAELRVEGQVVARGGSFTMGQILVSTAGLYDPGRGWQDFENTPPVAGEYRALAINAAGISARQMQALQEKLAATKTQIETQSLTGLTADELTGVLLYTTVLSYFATNDVAGQISAWTAGMVEERKPSFGSVTAKVQPQFLFGIPRTVTFPGLELDVTRMESLVVSKTSDHAARVAYIRQSGVRQSAYEHRILEQFFTNTAYPREAVSAVKALTVASRQGQRLYTITSETVASVLSQLTLDLDVKTEIEMAVATGKHAIVSQHAVTIENWIGVGYIIFDPDTGAGAYQISGGMNGGWITTLLVSLALFVAFLPLALAISSALAPALVFLFGAVIAHQIAALAIVVGGFALLLQAFQLPEGSPERGILANFAYSTIALGVAEFLGGGILVALAIMAGIAVFNYFFASAVRRTQIASLRMTRKRESFA